MNRQTTSAPSWLSGDRQPRPPAGDRQTARQTARPPAPDHQPGPPAATTSAGWRSPAVYHQPPPAPTHRIVVPPDRQPADLQDDHQEEDWDDAPATLRERIADAFAGLRFVRDSPGSLQDQLEYAREGAYTTRAGGPWRAANVVFARFIAAPGLTVCYFICWAFFTRLSRTITVLVVAAPLLAILNGVPVVELVIPDWADITSWMSGG